MIPITYNHLTRTPSRLHMKFNFISKSDFNKYESSKPSDTRAKVKVSGTTKVDSKAKTSIRNYFKERRELKRRIDQAVQRHLKRALLQLKN